MDWKVDQPRVLEGGGEGERDVDGDGGRDGRGVGRRRRGVRGHRGGGGGDDGSRLLQGDGWGGGGGGGEGEKGGGHPGLRLNDGLFCRSTHLRIEKVSPREVVRVGDTLRLM